jgi:3-phenylpropionate/trans-cinnamate dioxygenase ferredoxin subunit
MTMSDQHPVLNAADFREGEGVSVRIPGRRKPVAVFLCSGRFFAVLDECPHANASLSRGKVVDFILTCPHHGAQFDIRTGKAHGALAYGDLMTFPVAVEDGKVIVAV